MAVFPGFSSACGGLHPGLFSIGRYGTACAWVSPLDSFATAYPFVILLWSFRDPARSKTRTVAGARNISWGIDTAGWVGRRISLRKRFGLAALTAAFPGAALEMAC
jgi:hypothetical protein